MVQENTFTFQRMIFCLSWGLICQVVSGRMLAHTANPQGRMLLDRYRAGTEFRSASELDTGRKIRLLEVCKLYVCDSSAAWPDVTAHTGQRLFIKGSCGRVAGSAASL
jgi:hypothetical protein